MQTQDRSLQLFLSAFTARDLAEPLLSVDETASPETIRSAANGQEWDVIGVRRDGMIAGWLAREDFSTGQSITNCRALESATIIANSASLDEVIQSLVISPYLFVRVLGHVGGVISRRDIHPAGIHVHSQFAARGEHHTRSSDYWEPKARWKPHSRARQEADESESAKTRARSQRIRVPSLSPLTTCAALYVGLLTSRRSRRGAG